MLAIGLLSSMSAMAQNKQFTLEDLNFGGVNYRKFYPENRYTTWWGDRLIRLNLDYCAEVDKTSRKEKRIVSLDEINKVAGLSGSELVRSLYYAAFPYADKPVISVENSGERFLYNFKTKKVEWRSGVLSTDPGHNVYGDEKQSSEWNSASRATAFVAGNQLYVADAKGNIAKLTTDGSRDIVYGQSVHRDEFGINGGLFWSPKGNKLAF